MRGPVISARGGQKRRRRAEECVRNRHLCSLTLLTASLPGWAFAQGSPLLAESTLLQESLLKWLIPIALLLVMLLGLMARTRRISWAWCIGAIFGLAIACGAPVVVVWFRGMF